MAKEFIAKDTKQPLTVLGGYRISGEDHNRGAVIHEDIKKADLTDFKATHHDTLTKKKVMVRKTEHGHHFTWEDGGSGHDPGPLSNRYQALEPSQHMEG